MRPHLVLLLAALLTAAGCIPEPYPHSNPDDPDYSGTPGVTDGDGDGFDASADCDDGDAAIYPGADEVAYDGIDQDCDGGDLVDVDEDGYPGTQAGGADCDDGAAAVNPGADERCDGIDNDCDGDVDVNALDADTFWPDGDGDGYGDEEGAPFDACDTPDGYADNADDCDDTLIAVAPGEEEVCDGVDNNCNDRVDENVSTTYYLDGDGDGYGDDATATEACTSPGELYVTTGGDCNDAATIAYPGATEACEDPGRTAIDNDCDGNIDEGAGSPAYLDSDGDGYGDPAASTSACETPDGYVANADDCDDGAGAINPDADEICDAGEALDNDCDEITDEGVGQPLYPDSDGDGYGDASQQTLSCGDLEGYVTDSSDCDDTTNERYPGAPEACGDGIDSDCDGDDDPGDLDGDGTSDCADDDGDGYCEFTSCSGGALPGDCDDLAAGTSPAATELPTLVGDPTDEDCDGAIDEGFVSDADGDGYSEEEGDCDDADPSINPGAEELCDGIDQDCDGNATLGDADGVGGEDCEDQDGDGYCEGADCFEGLIPGDCDDEDGGVSPAAEEILNGEDDDCDGTIDDQISSAGAATFAIEDATEVGVRMMGATLSGNGPVILAYASTPEGDAVFFLSASDLASGLDAKPDTYVLAGSDAGLEALGDVGDFNGDGHPDVVLGAALERWACIFFGSERGFSGGLTERDADVCVDLGDTDFGQGRFGTLAFGDLDRDGKDELLLGMPGLTGTDGSTGDEAPGGVAIFQGVEVDVGGSDPLTLSLASPDMRIRGTAGQRLGSTITVLSDEDGVAADLVILGSEDASSGLGVLRILRAARDFPSGQLEEATIGGDTSHYLTGDVPTISAPGFGLAVMGHATDIVDDGIEALIVFAAPSETGAASRIYILSGGGEILNTEVDQSIGAEQPALEAPAGVTSASGGAVATLDQGAGRIFVGGPSAPETGDPAAGAGLVYGYKRDFLSQEGVHSEDALYSQVGPEAGAAMGRSLVCIDLGGDGFKEVYAGAGGRSGGDGGIVTLTLDDGIFER